MTIKKNNKFIHSLFSNLTGSSRIALMLSALFIAACGGGGGGSTPVTETPDPVYKTVILSVSDHNGIPLNQVDISIMLDVLDLDGNSITQLSTDDSGFVSFSSRVDDRSFITSIASKSGYLKAGFDIRLDSDNEIINADLQLVKLDQQSMPRGINYKDSSVSTDTSGTVLTETNVSLSDAHNDTLLELVIPQSAILTTSSGEPVTGALNVEVVDFDPTQNADLLKFFPGGKAVIADNAPSADGLSFTDNTSVSFAEGDFVSIHITDTNGNVVKQISSGGFSISAKVSKRIINPATENEIEAGEQIERWSYDEETGQWRFEEKVTLNDIGHDEYLGISYTSSHLSFGYYGHVYYPGAITPSISTVTFKKTGLINAPLLLDKRTQGAIAGYFTDGGYYFSSDKISIGQYSNVRSNYTFDYFGQVLTTESVVCNQQNCIFDIDTDSLAEETRTVSITSVASCKDGSNVRPLTDVYFYATYNRVRRFIGGDIYSNTINSRLPNVDGSIQAYAYTNSTVIKTSASGAIVNSGDTQIEVKFELKDEFCPASAVNTKPETTFSLFSVDEKSTFNGSLTATDEEGDTLNFRATSNPLHGLLTVNSDGRFSYTPLANYSGNDLFYYVANDGTEDSDLQRVEITINHVPTPPVSSSFSLEVQGDSDSILSLVTFTNNFSGSDLYAIEIVSVPTNGSLSNAGVNVIAGDIIPWYAATTLVYTPVSNTTAIDSFSWKGKGIDGWSNTSLTTINITAAPQISSFTTSLAAIIVGGSIDLTAVFSNGVGDINGDTVISATPVTLNPSVTTTYTLTVTGVDGTSVTRDVTVVVNELFSEITVSSNDVSLTEGDTGSANLVFNITLSAEAPVGGITFDYATIDGSATAGSDYVNTTGTLTFPAGSSTASVSVAVTGDLDIENTETFELQLSNPVAQGVVIANSGFSTRQGIIMDNDQVTGVTISDDNAGLAIVGDSLTGAHTYAGSTQLTLSWLRNGDVIGNASSSTYVLVSADSGAVITFKVTPVDESGTEIGSAVSSTGINVNYLPVFTSEASINVETGNVLTGYTAIAADNDGETVIFSLTGGADQSLFNIDGNTGILSFLVAADFSNPKDSDSDNNYIVEVGVTDGNSLITQTVTVSVTALNEFPPVFTNASAFGFSDGTSVYAYTAVATDEDGNTVTFSLTGGVDQNAFTIDADTGILNFLTTPDFFSPTDSDGNNSYIVEIAATDGKFSVSQVTTISVGSDMQLLEFTSGNYSSITEGSTDTGYIATTNGGNGGAITFSLTGGVDQAAFTIDSSSGVLRFTASSDFDLPVDSDSNNSYMVDITASSSTDSPVIQSVTIFVTALAWEADISVSSIGIKTIQIDWTAYAGATHYKLFVNPDGMSGYGLLQDSLLGLSTTIELPVHLTDWVNAVYLLEAHDDTGKLFGSSTIRITSLMLSSIGYFKADNTGEADSFGNAVSLSTDGNTLAVGAYNENNGNGAVYVYVLSGGAWTQQAYIQTGEFGVDDNFGYQLSLSADGNSLAVSAFREDSNAKGISTDGAGETDNSATDSGAAYIFTRSGNVWTQQAYIKASNSEVFDYFGNAISLSSDGQTLAVAAYREGSDANGISIDGTGESDNSASYSGAVYIFTYNGNSWTQQTYIKASNSDASDWFGFGVSLSSDGNTLAVGASKESSNATGISTDGSGEADNSVIGGSGAVYIFSRSSSSWIQQTYIKASNSQAYNSTSDYFGQYVDLSADGATLVVTAIGEDSRATGVSTDGTGETDNLGIDSGAAYVFSRSGNNWVQQAYIKASNSESTDNFGSSISLSDDGNSLALGTFREDSSALGISRNETGETDNTAPDSGAVYLFTRNAGSWEQKAYVKASNTNHSDWFGYSLSFSGDGSSLAVGGAHESSHATSIGGDQTDNSAFSAGAVYLY